MRIVLDTNVFISGVFFSGPPYDILDAWRRGAVQLVLSPEILNEYQETGEALSEQFPGVDLGPWIELAATSAFIVDAPPLPMQVCSDQDDDMFLACALHSNTRTVVSGDKALLAASGYEGITVLTPRQFVDHQLSKKR